MQIEEPQGAEAAHRKHEIQRTARLRFRSIAIELRSRWSDITREPIPDDMIELLRHADERTDHAWGTEET